MLAPLQLPIGNLYAEVLEVRAAWQVHKELLHAQARIRYLVKNDFVLSAQGQEHVDGLAGLLLCQWDDVHLHVIALTLCTQSSLEAQAGQVAAEEEALQGGLVGDEVPGGCCRQLGAGGHTVDGDEQHVPVCHAAAGERQIHGLRHRHDKVHLYGGRRQAKPAVSVVRGCIVVFSALTGCPPRGFSLCPANRQRARRTFIARHRRPRKHKARIISVIGVHHGPSVFVRLKIHEGEALSR
mmetsp:Transcript_21642/g.40379  ORF Transcript_21642/g.40379 Transcript_21642/m.40379 type:complete len:239 (-) Transcript_21642:1480-2196(-)